MLKQVFKIPARPAAKSVMTRLGIKEATEALLGRIRTAESQLDITGTYIQVEAQVSPGMTLLGGRQFPGEKLSEYMSGCGGALLLAATAGEKLAGEVSRLMDGDAQGAVILDAAAAAAVDNALGYMCEVWGRANSRLGLRTLERRFSPGYGDLPLSCQKTIYDMISADRLGISITGAYMLQPDKSVFAICGIAGR